VRRGHCWLYSGPPSFAHRAHLRAAARIATLTCAARDQQTLFSDEPVRTLLLFRQLDATYKNPIWKTKCLLSRNVILPAKLRATPDAGNADGLTAKEMEVRKLYLAEPYRTQWIPEHSTCSGPTFGSRSPLTTFNPHSNPDHPKLGDYPLTVSSLLNIVLQFAAYVPQNIKTRGSWVRFRDLRYRRDRAASAARISASLQH
jgi:hypothetical protein